MSTHRRSLLATPPALRSEFARLAFTYQASSPLSPGLVLRRGIVNGKVYESRLIAPSSVALEKRGFKTFARLREEQPATIITPTSTTPLSTTAPSPPNRRLRRFLATTSLALLLFATGFAMAAAPAAESINGFVAPPTDEETLILFSPATPAQRRVNDQILTHPLAAQLRASGEWTESRPHLKIPPAMRPHNLTGGTLLGENKLEVPPLTFQNKGAELPSLVQFSYVGSALCGHPGIVHGGLLATMLDEGLARACFPALPNKVGVTASLKIDYRVPCPANSFVVLKAETTKVEGRKAWVKGWIEILSTEQAEGAMNGHKMEGVKVVEAEALFIEPRNAAAMARVYSSQ